VKDLSILVTGGSGSFGNAFVRRALKDNPKRLVVYSRDEMKQDAMAHEFKHENLRFFCGDVRDQSRLELAMHGIDTVIHAAAMKIVPKCELDPTECVATNIMGATNVVRAAIRAGVSQVVALSTDKAVNPINLYGASKLAAEKIFVAANSLGGSRCRFSVVRYGNVLGSRGSVVPLFKRLAAEGKPLPITDINMTRFWIKMDQAIDLVLLCSEQGMAREIVIPKLPSMKIVDLAEAIDPGGKREIVGVRPGEKIHECLMTEDESLMSIDDGGHYVLRPDFMDETRTPVRYTSDTNDRWLSVEQLRAMI